MPPLYLLQLHVSMILVTYQAVARCCWAVNYLKARVAVLLEPIKGTELERVAEKDVQRTVVKFSLGNWPKLAQFKLQDLKTHCECRPRRPWW